MRLMIAIPTHDTVRHEFMTSLIGLVEHLNRRGIEHRVAIVAGTLIYKAREELAAQAINGGWTHVLWLDSDMQFEPTIVDALAAAKVDFVSGIYCTRRLPCRMTIFRSLIPIVHFEEIPAGVFEIAACGFACVLTSTALLGRVLRQAGSCFTPTREFSEDLAFCARVHDAGGRMYADGRVTLGHAGSMVYWPDKRGALNDAMGAGEAAP